MREIIQEMNRNGFNPNDLVLDGKIHRFGDKKKSNWYIGFSNFTRSSGEPFYIALYGSWKSGETFTFNSNVEMTAEDKRFMKQTVEEAKRKALYEKEKLQSQVAEECDAFFQTLPENEVTEYMFRKKIPRLFGARSHMGQLYVPMRDETGKLWGIQTITNDGSKYFAEGQRLSGTFHAIGNLESEIIYICEGFATGVSIHAALSRPVVCAFTASNLLAVSEALKQQMPDRKFIICGDDDLWTVNSKGEPWNPGREKATDAAKKIMADVVFPKFLKTDSKPTDFNDLFLLEGPDALKKQIEPIRGQRHFVRSLGFIEKQYFFTSSSNQQIVEIYSFSEVDFLNLMPKEYWEQVYPGPRGGVDWSAAKSDLMTQCRRKGIFSEKKIRGSGVWRDRDKILVNLGDRLLVNNSEVGLQDFKSDFFYSLGRSLPEIEKTIASRSDCERLLETCEAFRWQKNDFSKFLAGFLVISKICGALSIRPHVWLTGGSQTGKTTLLEKLIYPFLDKYCLYLRGGSSEAGLRQSLKHDSVPVIFDEFEMNGPKSQELIQSCIEIMRSAWSESHSGIAKGSAGGSAQMYYPRFSALVSSIRISLNNDADRSRFTVIELAPHGSDENHWRYLSGLLMQIDQAFVDRIFMRSIKMIPVLEMNFKTIRAALSLKVGSRFGDQHGMLLAGYWTLKSDEPITVDQAEDLISSPDMNEEKIEAKITDEEECLSHILSIRLDLMIGKDRISSNLNSILEKYQHRNNPVSDCHAYLLAIENIGLKINEDGLHVAFNHPELKKLFRETRWINCWSKSLKRIPGSKKKSCRFVGRVCASTLIPSDYLFNFSM